MVACIGVNTPNHGANIDFSLITIGLTKAYKLLKEWKSSGDYSKPAPSHHHAPASRFVCGSCQSHLLVDHIDNT